jgi:putative transposase
MDGLQAREGLFSVSLTLRMVEEMLAARGIDVSHESVRHRAEKFGREYSNCIRGRAPARGDKCQETESAPQHPQELRLLAD